MNSKSEKIKLVPNVNDNNYEKGERKGGGNAKQNNIQIQRNLGKAYSNLFVLGLF